MKVTFIRKSEIYCFIEKLGVERRSGMKENMPILSKTRARARARTPFT